MRARDTIDVLHSVYAVLADGAMAALALLAATWIRFDSGLWARDWTLLQQWFFGSDGHWSDPKYLWAAALAVAINYWSMRHLHLYRRPQTGQFGDTIPRIVRAILTDSIIGLILIALLRNRLFGDFSSGVVLLFIPCALLLILLERGILFHMEIRQCRRRQSKRKMLVIGTDSIAARIVDAYSADPRLRIQTAGLFQTSPTAPIDPRLASIPILGNVSAIEEALSRLDSIRLLVVADSADISRDRLAALVRLCERHLIRFVLVPDLFRVMTSTVDVEAIGEIPLLGLGRWPLENAWNRAAKRLVDILGGLVGLILSAPIVLVFALLHRHESPGPCFYKQIRCGYRGHPFTIYKLRTMHIDAEDKSGPVFTRPDDPRRTRIGSWMREHNIDELPQFWNVLRGDMSLVGPRPERPIFVERFSEDINHYMWRHSCRPGITGWAQVNGYRGDTSIEGRLRCDLYYLENWSLALDLKILVRTLFARTNAY